MVLRPLTEQDKRDFKDATRMSAHEKKFFKKLTDKTTEMHKTLKPFCRPCAINKFRKKIEQTREYLQELASSGAENVEVDEELLKIDIDLDEYAGEYMEFIGENIVMDKKIINGTPVQVPVKFKEYKCKKFGHGVSIQQDTEMSKLNQNKSE